MIDCIFDREYLFGDIVNKRQIICPVVAISLGGVVLALVNGRSHHRYHVYAQTRMIGEELSTTTNSPRLVRIGAELQKQLADLLASPSAVAEVQLGDEPSPIGDGSACSRLILSNAVGRRIGIRLRQDSEAARFNVLDYWTVTEQGAPPRR